MQIIPVTYFEQPHPLVLGQYYEGGLVAYLTGSFPNQKAIIVSMDWIGVRQWGIYGQNLSATSYDLFTGVTNTDLIIAADPTFDGAAKLAKNYNGSGYTDWCLPSADDLSVICQNRDPYLLAANWNADGKGTWTSTQSVLGSPPVSSNFQAYEVVVGNGYSGCTPQGYTSKNQYDNVRPVRYVQMSANQQQ